MSFILTLAGIVLLFSLTIFVHELGHFLVARLCGLTVEAFSIGFGPALWQRKRGGTLYKIGALPFGGYVALPQLDPTGGAAAEPGKPVLPPAPPGRRIAVSAAGAIFNLLFAFLLAWIVFLVGKPSAPHERRCVVGYVEEASEAWETGLRIGDEILRADGKPVSNWQDLLTQLTLSS
ncbi:MAG: site-2 protease family protein, partial [Kiritimatiellia bacterium]|nr:site-2 protease family protein [Kiritimatiellia bacterium]